MQLDLDLHHTPPRPSKTAYGIGAVGAGFIMRDIHLKAYADAQFNVVAITSRTPEIAREVADFRAIPKVYESLSDMLRDPEVELLDVAVPPDQQLAVIREAAETGKHLKGILAQKPLAVEYSTALEIVEICRKARLPLVVNQNMRYDQSVRALKTILERQYLGTPVLASIEMRAVPHWQSWLKNYGRLTLLNMSVHHLDTFRYLFGNPESIFVSARKDPRTKFAHEDGICLYVLEYADGLRATGWDDVWAGPRTNEDSMDPYIKWRVEGTEGVAEGMIGWPNYPSQTPSTLRFATSQAPDVWLTPKWKSVWFPDAFQGPMSELMEAVASGTTPPTSGEDNLDTMALIEAGYLSLKERRLVPVEEARERSSVREQASEGMARR